eukprot:GHVU01145773.1.p1 GENE.GHVU01145773.1~~GHVU01145773.1.p1  ORF type:complete len:858 (-),score=25.98 GHVU01145773.1:1764-4337(-)
MSFSTLFIDDYCIWTQESPSARPYLAAQFSVESLVLTPLYWNNLIDNSNPVPSVSSFTIQQVEKVDNRIITVEELQAHDSLAKFPSNQKAVLDWSAYSCVWESNIPAQYWDDFSRRLAIREANSPDSPGRRDPPVFFNCEDSPQRLCASFQHSTVFPWLTDRQRSLLFNLDRIDINSNEEIRELFTINSFQCLTDTVEAETIDSSECSLNTPWEEILGAEFDFSATATRASVRPPFQYRRVFTASSPHCADCICDWCQLRWNPTPCLPGCDCQKCQQEEERNSDTSEIAPLHLASLGPIRRNARRNRPNTNASPLPGRSATNPFSHQDRCPCADCQLLSSHIQAERGTLNTTNIVAPRATPPPSFENLSALRNNLSNRRPTRHQVATAIRGRTTHRSPGFRSHLNNCAQPITQNRQSSPDTAFNNHLHHHISPAYRNQIVASIQRNRNLPQPGTIHPTLTNYQDIPDIEDLVPNSPESSWISPPIPVVCRPPPAPFCPATVSAIPGSARPQPPRRRSNSSPPRPTQANIWEQRDGILHNFNILQSEISKHYREVDLLRRPVDTPEEIWNQRYNIENNFNALRLQITTHYRTIDQHRNNLKEINRDLRRRLADQRTLPPWIDRRTQVINVNPIVATQPEPQPELNNLHPDTPITLYTPDTTSDTFRTLLDNCANLTTNPHWLQATPLEGGSPYPVRDPQQLPEDNRATREQFRQRFNQSAIQERDRFRAYEQSILSRPDSPPPFPTTPSLQSQVRNCDSSRFQQGPNQSTQEFAAEIFNLLREHYPIDPNSPAPPSINRLEFENPFPPTPTRLNPRVWRDGYDNYDFSDTEQSSASETSDGDSTSCPSSSEGSQLECD